MAPAIDADADADADAAGGERDRAAVLPGRSLTGLRPLEGLGVRVGGLRLRSGDLGDRDLDRDLDLVVRERERDRDLDLDHDLDLDLERDLERERERLALRALLPQAPPDLLLRAGLLRPLPQPVPASMLEALPPPPRPGGPRDANSSAKLRGRSLLPMLGRRMPPDMDIDMDMPPPIPPIRRGVRPRGPRGPPAQPPRSPLLKV